MEWDVKDSIISPLLSTIRNA